MDYNLKDIPDLYYENNSYLYNEYNMDIERKYNDYLERIIFSISENKKYSLKCQFYSGNVIDINISNYIYKESDNIKIDIGKIIFSKYSKTYAFISIIKDNNNYLNNNYIDTNNINNIKINFDIKRDSYLRKICNIAQNNNIIYLNYDATIDIKEDINNNIVYNFICIKNGTLNTKIIVSDYMLDYFVNINKSNIKNMTNYSYINFKNSKICEIYEEINNKYHVYKNIDFDLIYKYYNNNNDVLHLLLVKYGSVTFNDHINCKLCENKFKSINNNNYVFRHFFRNILLCKFHSELYYKKLNSCFTYIFIDKSLLFNMINNNIDKINKNNV